MADIVEKARKFNCVLPDVERPYAWGPRQVALLIDSMFRGLPLGSLLIWEIKPEWSPSSGWIRLRPFREIVDRSGTNAGRKILTDGPLASRDVVVDGHQRVQSLILALGGDQWGFRLLDTDWAQDLHGGRCQPGKHWSKGSLCVDLQKFSIELHAKNDRASQISVGKILEWAILDPITGLSEEPRPADYVYPLETAKNYPGRFICLSRLWNMAQQGLNESKYKALLKPMLNEHDACSAALMDPLAEFMKVVERVKVNSFFHSLQIESFKPTLECSENDYWDAIISTLTRQYKTGRHLSNEEIIIAQLEYFWPYWKFENKQMRKCVEDLRIAFVARGFQVTSEQIALLICFVWAVECNDGAPLDSGNVIKIEILRPMAESIAATWASLKHCVERAADLIKTQGIHEDSVPFNAMMVYLTWHHLVFDRFETISADISVIEQDRLEKQLNQCAATFLARWISVSPMLSLI